MFCTNCGKQVADAAKFCPNCGSPTITNQKPAPSSASPEPQPTTNKKAPTGSKKKVPLIIGVVAVVVILAIAAASLLGGGSDRDKAIQTVKTGYLGTFTDITVEEIINYTFMGNTSGQGVIWDGGTTDEDVMIVEARYTDSDGQETQLQFRMMDDQTFRYGGMTGISDLKEAVKYLNMMYYNYYVLKNSEDLDAAEKVVERLDQVSCGAVLCGASADYEGDRENLYQSAFDMEALPATAANYLGLLQTEQPAALTYDTSVYDNILGGYYIALADGYSASMLEENDFNALCAYYDAFQVGYTIQDVDGNGVPELLIGEIGEAGGGSGAFFDLYTLVDGQVVLVAASSERDRYYICQDGSIANEGSFGADDSYNAYYTIDPTTGTRSILEAVIYQGFYEDAGPWFYTTLEPWEASVYDGSQTEIFEAEAAQIMQNHSYKAIEFQAIPAV